MIFTPNILVDYQDGLLSLGPVGPRGGWGHSFKNVCTIQHSWFYPDFCAKHLGEFSSLIVVFGPKAQLLKCVNTPIFLILSLFLCQTFWGVIFPRACVRSTAPSLGSVEPRGGKGTISKMCVQFKILDSILIFVPNIWGSYNVPTRTLDPARTLVDWFPVRHHDF